MNRQQAPGRRLTKAERREIARAAMLKARAARRRSQIISVAIGSAFAVVLIGAAALVFIGAGKDGDNGKEPAASASASPSASRSKKADFPPLPAGADPALRTKPKAEAGSGELTRLTVTPLIEGTGAATAVGQTITANYVGVSYRTGEEFDASWSGESPIEFKLGVGEVIKGWDQGLVGVKVGSRVQLDIPSDLAYGDEGGGGASGPLRFIVDVLAVR